MLWDAAAWNPCEDVVDDGVMPERFDARWLLWWWCWWAAAAAWAAVTLLPLPLPLLAARADGADDDSNDGGEEDRLFLCTGRAILCPCSSYGGVGIPASILKKSGQLLASNKL